MNTYAASSVSGATSGLRGYTMNGSTSFTASYSGTYYITAAADDAGTGTWGGSSYSISGFNSGGSTTSKYFSGGTNVTITWSIQNSGGTNGDSFATNPVAVAFIVTGPDQPPAPTVSISLSKSSIINNGTDKATLSWSASGNVSSVSVTSISSPGTSGSADVRPTSSTTYFITASGEGGTSSSSVTLTVYQPPVVSLSLDRSSIAAGESTTLRWTTTGDASSISWTSGGITNTNLNSNSSVSPVETRTYSATVSGLGGSDSDSITLTVNQIPTASISVPQSLDYGTQGTISYTSSYSNTSLIVTPTYTYTNGTTTTGTNVVLSTPTSTQLNAVGSSVSGTFPSNIPYNTIGPITATYVISAQGSGGTASATSSIAINIDQVPNNIIIPETEEAIKNEDPVITPDITVTSEVIEIQDIDIPVEVKADRPIQVRINDSASWQNLRQIT